MLEKIMRYYENGLYAIPLYSPAMHQKKEEMKWYHKNLKENKNFQYYVYETPLVDMSIYENRLPNKEIIRKWFTKWPIANVGFINTEKSNLVVLKVNKQVTKEYFNEEDHVTLTPIIETKNSYKFLFYLSSIEHLYEIHDRTEMLLESGGKYIVGPHSVDESGFVNKWKNNFSIFEMKLCESDPNLNKLYLKLLRTKIKLEREKKYIPEPEYFLSKKLGMKENLTEKEEMLLSKSEEPFARCMFTADPDEDYLLRR